MARNRLSKNKLYNLILHRLPQLNYALFSQHTKSRKT